MWSAGMDLKCPAVWKSSGAKKGSTTVLEWCFYCSSSFSTKLRLIFSMTVYIRPGATSQDMKEPAKPIGLIRFKIILYVRCINKSSIYVFEQSLGLIVISFLVKNHHSELQKSDEVRTQAHRLNYNGFFRYKEPSLFVLLPHQTSSW